MFDNHPHPLLSQIPLTVSPFLSLPSATTLPYTYKTLSSTLPPSIVDRPSGSSGPPNNNNDNNNNSDGNNINAKPQYVVSSSGHAAHPDTIIASCQALRAHLQKMEKEATETVRKWENEIRERDLAEKRRVAPGWLDAEERMLVPQSTGNNATQDLLSGDDGADGKEGDAGTRQAGEEMSDREGEELDRAFGGFGLK